jgi:hypothetical protein
MKIEPATALAIWAIATAWLLLFLILERWDRPGIGLFDWIEILAAVAGIAAFPPIRKGFAAWLAGYSPPER